jgi:hypothetical protein
MSLRVFALTCGHLTGDLGRLMEGGEGRIRMPVPAYLIEHPTFSGHDPEFWATVPHAPIALA